MSVEQPEPSDNPWDITSAMRKQLANIQRNIAAQFVETPAVQQQLANIREMAGAQSVLTPTMQEQIANIQRVAATILDDSINRERIREITSLVVASAWAANERYTVDLADPIAAAEEFRSQVGHEVFDRISGEGLDPEVLREAPWRVNESWSGLTSLQQAALEGAVVVFIWLCVVFGVEHVKAEFPVVARTLTGIGLTPVDAADRIVGLFVGVKVYRSLPINKKVKRWQVR